jgi:hypothetical protein
MTVPNDNPRVTGNKRRINKSVGWAIAGAVVLLMFGLMFVARGPHPPMQSETPNTPAQTQPER